MPVYEYRCEDCGRLNEVLRPMREADEVLACEGCGSRRTQRVHSVFAAGSSEGKGEPIPPGPGCACGDPAGPCRRG